MLLRKIENALLTWKNTKDHNPLIVKGCRQCGKTFSVLEFANKNYEHVIYLNFLQNASYASIFADSLEVDHLIMMMSALLGPEARFVPGKTVIILLTSSQRWAESSTITTRIPAWRLIS